MKSLRWIGVVFGCLVASCSIAQTQLETDEATLKSAKLPTEGPALLDFFMSRSLKEGDAKELEALVKSLDSGDYKKRETAMKKLVGRGPVSLPFLRGALADSPLEMKRRAEMCIKDIEATMQSEPIAAAARVLVLRKQPKAAEALFNFLPSINTDPYLEEEILACVGRLTITPKKVDPLILDALKDKYPFRRHAAAYLVGRRGGPEHREQLREMLADDDVRVPQRVAEGLYGKRAGQTLAEAVIGDEALLKSQKMEVTEPALLKFISNRTLSEADQKHYRSLVKEMGSSTYSVREQATKKLLKDGIKVLPFLKEVEYDLNAERAKRAQESMKDLRNNNNTGIPIAAAHLLARPPQKKDASPAESIRTLLAYIPFVDDEAVEEEVLTSLTILSLREPKVEPALVKALTDDSPARRAAAAYVLGHVGTKEHVALVLPLLDDRQAVVRLRAAQGMLAAREKAAVPSFIKLVETVPAPYLPRVEEILSRLAEDKGPVEPIAATSRDAAAKAWGKWLADNKDKIDLTNLGDRETFLGLVTICEYDNPVGQINGQVWESARGGPKRWSFGGQMGNTSLVGPMDAHTLPNGRILIAENSGNRVTERDSKGEIKWQVQVPNNPIACQRLPNGNTFIASYNMVMEVRPDKSEVYRITQLPNNVQFYIFGAHKAKNGNIVVINAQGNIVEMDSKGKLINAVNTQTLGNWCSVEMQSNGNYLVASMNPGTVRELDRKGTEVWSKQFPGVFRATKLPNGNVLCASMNTREVVEMDRGGAIRWRVTTQGRPWSVHYR
jgi:HEAT repeat protein